MSRYIDGTANYFIMTQQILSVVEEQNRLGTWHKCYGQVRLLLDVLELKNLLNSRQIMSQDINDRAIQCVIMRLKEILSVFSMTTGGI